MRYSPSLASIQHRSFSSPLILTVARFCVFGFNQIVMGCSGFDQVVDGGWTRRGERVGANFCGF